VQTCISSPCCWARVLERGDEIHERKVEVEVGVVNHEASTRFPPRPCQGASFDRDRGREGGRGRELSRSGQETRKRRLRGIKDSLTPDLATDQGHSKKEGLGGESK